MLNHIGLPLGIGVHASQKEQAFADWRAGLKTVASHPNMFIKLGGMGMHMLGLALDHLPGPFSSEEVAQEYQPYVYECVSAFGAHRCMFESNFPVDRTRCDYRTLWNAFKRTASHFSEDEKASLFAGAARSFYRLHE
ncbi:Amidohydrolase [compost metagenome]